MASKGKFIGIIVALIMIASVGGIVLVDNQNSDNCGVKTDSSAITSNFNDGASVNKDVKTYRIYIEVIDDDGTVELTEWVKFDSEPNNDAWAEAATTAVAAYGIADLTFTAKEDGIWVNSAAPGYNATYYAEGENWVAITDTLTQYVEKTVIGLAVQNGYISEMVYSLLPMSEKANWTYVGYGGDYDYMKLLEAKANAYPESMTYYVFVEIIKADGTVETSKWIKFDSDKTAAAFVASANKAMADNGLSKVVLTKSGTYISVKYDGSGNTHSQYAKNGKWINVSDTTTEYVGNAVLTFAVNHGYIGTDVYNALSDEQKKAWQPGDMGDWPGYEYMRDCQEIPIFDSGVCGDGLMWYFTKDTRELKIDGNGAMYDYTGNDKVPWYVYRESISSLILPSGLTTIGNYAFSGCSMLSGSITIPNTVTIIGKEAFSDCSGLSGKLIISDNVKTVGALAFSGCVGIKTIEIGKDAKGINATAFPSHTFYKEDGTTQISVGSTDFYGYTFIGETPEKMIRQTSGDGGGNDNTIMIVAIAAVAVVIAGITVFFLIRK